MILSLSHNVSGGVTSDMKYPHKDHPLPSDPHDLCDTPFSEKPVLHVYEAVTPSAVRKPFRGVVGVVQAERWWYNYYFI